MSDKRQERVLDALELGHAAIPYILLASYRATGLTDQDMMVIIQMTAYQQQLGSFPSLDELAARMSLSKADIAATLQRLFGEGLIRQVEGRVSIRPLLERALSPTQGERVATSIFVRFEEEFGRLLSPLEYEQILLWLQQDAYPEWMVTEALRESVLSGVFNFRYVDTILRDWSRQRITTAAQLTDYRNNHRRPAAKEAGRARGRR
ncbi:MAG: DnaD domain protein, partial [Firmicutes bacterium]|nr:DnaD domain protein [Bacillota bacterium]